MCSSAWPAGAEHDRRDRLLRRTDAIASGRDAIRSGEADLMIVGSSEACVSRFGMSLLCKTGVLTHQNEEPEKASRPYDRGATASSWSRRRRSSGA